MPSAALRGRKIFFIFTDTFHENIVYLSMNILTFVAGLLAVLPTFYRNPILHSDYSDPDAICVNGEYWMTSSSFNCIPGLQILHSTNLVDWEIVNAALPKGLQPEEFFSPPRHGCGVWAPSIRYFNGKYWIFWGDPDFGVFQVHADHPAGEWSEPVCIWKGKGIIDTCPLLDDDGRIYMVHAWAGSRAGFKSVLAVCELDSGCTCIKGEQVLVFDGKKSGNETVEGPKFYKRDGWYYIFAPSGGVKEGWQLVLRSRNVYGPYESKVVLHQGNSDIHGPHQGAWVEDAAGDSWFLHFEDRYAFGRVVHLQPMSWTEDGWCTMGVDGNGDGIGEPVGKYRRPAAYPAVPVYPRAVPALESACNFNHEYIPYNWQWHANPEADWALMNPSESCLRLNCIRNPEGWRNLWDTPNLLLEKVLGPGMEVSARLVFRPSYKGDRCGLVMMGDDYSALDLLYDGGTVSLRRLLCTRADKGTEEQTEESVILSGDGSYSVWLRLKVLEGGMCRFSYSLDGKSYNRLGQDFRMKAGRWIGAKAGFYATAEIKKNDGGSVEVY